MMVWKEGLLPYSNAAIPARRRVDAADCLAEAGRGCYHPRVNRFPVREFAFHRLSMVASLNHKSPRPKALFPTGSRTVDEIQRRQIHNRLVESDSLLITG
jgi:hypothetical protein